MKIWIVWRVNVGKSTLFNRLLWNYRAIVTEIPWTTRELIAEQIKIDDKHYALLTDSPWLEKFEEEMFYIKQIIKDSDIIIFVVDGKTGLWANDQQIKDAIMKAWKKGNTIFAVNKLDGKVFWRDLTSLLSEYYSLWFETVLPIAAKTNDNLEALLEQIKILKKKLKLKRDDKIIDNSIPVAFVWRPNVWKSTLLNKLAQEDISKVDSNAWTTLDYLIWKVNYHGTEFKIFDTAWIRKRWKIKWLEKIALDKTVEMIKYVNPITVILLDAAEWVTHRDLSLIWEMIRLEVPLVIAINKTDLISKDIFEKHFRQMTIFFDFAKWIPIIPISAQEWVWLPALLNFIKKIWDEYNQEISTSEINKIINSAWMKKPPRFPKNHVCKIFYWLQKSWRPPTFIFFVNKKDYINFAFKKWLENVLRQEHWFVWIPLRFEFNERERR